MERAVNILSAIFDSFDDVWFFISPDYSIRYFNQKAANNSKLFHQKELKAGDSILNFARDTQNDVDKTFIANFQKSLAGEIIKVEDHIVYNSTSIWTRTKYTPVFENGNLLGISLLIEDITPQKQIEEERNKQQEEILMLSSKTQEFVNIASHELKTPLTSLKASLQIISNLLEKDNNNNQIRRFVDKSNTSVSKLHDLISILLNANRISEGELKLKKKHFNLYQLFESSSENVTLDGRHQVEIKGPQDLMIYADRDKIDHVITHLLNNVVKHAPKSQKIVVQLEELEESVKVTVQDFGPGISKEKVAHVFKRYYQGETKNSNSGMGLGLFIADGIIKEHDGEIGVESEKGKGSTFWFTLPKQER